MADRYSDPEEVQRAMARASGSLGQQIVRFPLQFAQPVIIGTAPEPNTPTQVHNGTATLIQIAGREFAVTCAHVLHKHREVKAAADRRWVFQIGMLEFDPEERLTGYDRRLDLAVFDVTGLKHSRASVRGGAFHFHEPVAWPPPPPGGDERVSLAGFPGVWRQEPADDHIDFDTFAIGAHPVESSHRDRLALAFERKYWVSAYGTRGQDFTDLGGMSGGPVMVMRTLHWDVAGFITDFSPTFDLLFAAPAARLRADGGIESE